MKRHRRRVVIAADFVLRGGTRKGGRPTDDRVVGHVMDKVGSKSVSPSVIHKRTTPLFDSCFSGNQTATSVTNDQKTEILVGADQSLETVCAQEPSSPPVPMASKKR